MILTPKATRGMEKAGDLLVPGTEGLPSFSQSGLIREADRMLAYLPGGDRKKLVDLAELFAWLPSWAIAALFWLAGHASRFPDPVGSLLRQLDLGVKGFLYTLYYSDPAIRKRLGWDTHIQRETAP